MLGLFDVELQEAGPQDVDEENDVEGEEGERDDTVRDRPSPAEDDAEIVISYHINLHTNLFVYNIFWVTNW